MEIDALEKSRTVVVSGVPKVLPVGRMIDKLTIHFQRCRRSHGGDVEVVQYPTNMDGVAFVTFDKPADAERVVLKEEQIMMDEEFPTDYLLTVFPLTEDVFLYVSRAEVDLSVFGSDQASLIQSLRSAHRSLHFLPLLKQRKATVEGPFTAVQALRDDLIRRADQLKSIDSSQTAAVKIPETSLNPEQTSKVTTVIQQALEELQTLVESWVTTLRVHEIDLDEEEHRQKQEVVQICDFVNFLYDDVLYMFEGSRIKVIGPSSSSHLFCTMAKGRLSRLQDKYLKNLKLEQK
ncbi:RNA-binding protein 43 [Tautogolabrus adspersus]